jgi:hypothetical protein
MKDYETREACITHGIDKNIHKISVRKPEGKRPLGRPRRRRCITLQRILEKKNGKLWIGLNRLRIETSDGLL